MTKMVILSSIILVLVGALFADPKRIVFNFVWWSKVHYSDSHCTLV